MASRDFDRRSMFRLAGLGLLVAGCSASDPAAPSTGAPTGLSSSRVAPTSRPTTTPTAAPFARYVPLSSEPLPKLKTVAAGFLERLTDGGDGGAEGGVARALELTGTGFDASSAAQVAAPLFTEPKVRGELVYPQFGGLVPLGPGARSASIMAVLRHRLTSSTGRERDEVRVCEVRLEVQGGIWRVVELASVGGVPVDRPRDLDPRAAAVLDDPRIELPDTARWDVHAGSVAPALLDVLAQASRTAPVSVTVLRSGHPVNVFGTNRPSDHSRGRAVDLWRVGGQAVIDSGPAGGLTGELQRAAHADRRVSQVGSPSGSDLDGPGSSRSFANLVHADHLHLAVKDATSQTVSGG